MAGLPGESKMMHAMSSLPCSVNNEAPGYMIQELHWV